MSTPEIGPDPPQTAHPLPCPVWIKVSAGTGYAEQRFPGLLLEWRRAPDNLGTRWWEGLVLYARRSESHVRWSASLEWVRDHMIEPMVV